MTFGPNSNNPRERRAFAHTKLLQARRSGDTGDFNVAHFAVERAGSSRKSRAANFAMTLMRMALMDEATRTIVAAAERVADPVQTGSTRPPTKLFTDKGLSPYAYAGRARTTAEAQLRPGDAYLDAGYLVELATGKECGLIDIALVEIQENSFESHAIPLKDGRVDIVGVRMIPDELRTLIGSFAARIV